MQGVTVIIGFRRKPLILKPASKFHKQNTHHIYPFHQVKSINCCSGGSKGARPPRVPMNSFILTYTFYETYSHWAPPSPATCEVVARPYGKSWIRHWKEVTYQRGVREVRSLSYDEGDKQTDTSEHTHQTDHYPRVVCQQPRVPKTEQNLLYS